MKYEDKYDNFHRFPTGEKLENNVEVWRKLLFTLFLLFKAVKACDEHIATEMQWDLGT